jgi:hypothetical protein
MFVNLKMAIGVGLERDIFRARFELFPLKSPVRGAFVVDEEAIQEVYCCRVDNMFVANW